MKHSPKYIIIATLSCVTLSLLVSSCQKFLAVDPKDQIPEEKLFKTYAGNQAALISCYNTLRGNSLYGQALMYSSIESMANDWNEPNSLNQKSLLDLYQHNYTSQSSQNFIKSVYNRFFNVIVQANNILKYKGEGITNADDRSIILGEAHAVRALCYLDLLRLFGPVPLHPNDMKLTYSLTDSYKVNQMELSYKEYVEKLTEEFKTAENLLVNTDPVKEYSYDELNNIGAQGYEDVKVEDQFMMNRQLRLNYWAVRALDARFSLYVGNRDRAHTLAMEILNAKGADGKPIVSLSSLSDFNKGYYSAPSEGLFILSIQNLNDETLPLLGGTASVKIESTTSLWQYKDIITNRIFENKNLTDDIRYKNLWEFGSQTISGSDIPTIKKFYYPDPSSNSEASVNNVKLKESVLPIIRLSEIYLIAMETSKDLIEVNKLYTEYMKSKNVLLTSDYFSSLDEVQKQIPHEYMREFMAEGVMFYLYKRLDATQFLLTDTRIVEDDYILPHPERESDKKTENK